MTRTTRRLRTAAATLTIGVVGATLALPGGPAAAATTTFTSTERVSVTTDGSPAGQANGYAFVSGDGRYVAFTSATKVTADDTDAVDDVFVRDRLADTTSVASLTDGEASPFNDSVACGMSSDARYVGFTSNSNNLTGTPGTNRLYRRDRTAGTTVLVSQSTGGSVGEVSQYDRCPISDDGRYVAFVSGSDNLVAADANGSTDVFRRDVQTGTTIRVSVTTGSAEVHGASWGPAMDDSGAKIAFASDATDVVGGDGNAKSDIFLRSLTTSVTTRVSVDATGTDANGGSSDLALSGDGTKVAFTSSATDLVAGDDDQNLTTDVFVRNLGLAATTRVSVDSLEQPGESGKVSWHPSLSQDGRYVAFSSQAKLYVGDNNGDYDAYVRDTQLGSTLLASRRAGTIEAGDLASNGWPTISDDGRVVAFYALAQNLVRGPAKTNDFYVHDFAVDMAPLDGMTAFVTQQFTDFEGRAPTAAELTEWKARLTNGETSPDHLINLFAHGTTWSGKRAPVIRLYWSFFLRQPDKGGLDFWVGKLASGKSLQWIASQFALSNEFKTTYGSLSNAAFVTLIYQNIFDRDPDAGGLEFWTAKLDAKAKTRGDVMTNFSESPEGKRYLAPQVDVILTFLGLLRSMPSGASFALGVAGLRAGTPTEAVIQGLRTSAPYAARF